MKRKEQEAKGGRKRRVLIVDDHAVLREGLALVINQQPDLVVCGEAEDERGALKLVGAAEPDVAIVDLSLMSGSGLDLIKDIVGSGHADLPMLVLSLHDETLYAERALRAGARGYIMKRASTAEVIAALRTVLDGGIYLSERMASLAATWKTKTHRPDRAHPGDDAQPSAANPVSKGTVRPHTRLRHAAAFCLFRSISVSCRSSWIDSASADASENGLPSPLAIVSRPACAASACTLASFSMSAA